MENTVSGLSSLLDDLKEPASTEKALATLSALYGMISSKQKLELLHRAGVFSKILNLLRTEDKLASVCLKILAKASKRNEKIRTNLLKNNIFFLLATHLRKESDVSTRSLVLYTTLIVILVQDNYEAKTQMRTSGCLSLLVDILACILEGADVEPPPFQNTQLIIYSIVASIKNPYHAENQTEVGWITPKIMEYLGKQKISSRDQDFELVKYFWSFLKCLVDSNDPNQKIFMKSFGLNVLFRSLQEIINDRKCDEMVDLLIKLTSLLAKLKSRREFLFYGFNYCSVIMLCNLLKTNNTLVVDQTIKFLDSLSQEIPQVLNVLRDNGVASWMKRARTTQSNGELGRGFAHRTGTPTSSGPTSQDEILSINECFSDDLNEHSVSDDVKMVYSLQGGKDVVPSLHGSPVKSLQASDPQARLRSALVRIRRSIAHLTFHRNELREKEKKLRKFLKGNWAQVVKDNMTNVSFAGVIRRGIRTLWSSFFGGGGDHDDDDEDMDDASYSRDDLENDVCRRCCTTESFHPLFS